MKKQIRLKCVDFWEGFNAEEDFLIKLLKENMILYGRTLRIT